MTGEGDSCDVVVFGGPCRLVCRCVQALANLAMTRRRAGCAAVADSDSRGADAALTALARYPADLPLQRAGCFLVLRPPRPPPP
jgi:hypothetical protein